MEERKYGYLDLLEGIHKRLDQFQYKVCIEDNNVVVAAGAGSGKTQVLATRFAWLVMSKNIPCGKILTLTFTNKAAGEMYERIYKTLSFFAQNPKTPEPEKSRALQALNDFSDVHIQTLDSYCSSIVRQVSNLYGIRPDFVTGNSTTDIEDMALPFVFSNKDRPSVKTYAKAGDLQGFASKILVKGVIQNTSLATPADYFSTLLQNQVKEICRNWNYFICGSGRAEDFNQKPGLATAVDNVLLEWNKFTQEQTNDWFRQVKSALDVYIELERELNKQNLTFSKLICANESDFERPEILLAVAQMERFFKIVRKSMPRSGSKKPVKDAYDVIRGNTTSLKTGYLEQLISPVVAYIKQFKAIKDFCRLMDEFTAKVNDSKRLTGNLSFKDVGELSLKILIENKELRKQEKAAFSRIMIDEFQDNNGKNRDLLFLLSEKCFEDQSYGCKDGIPSVEDIEENKLFFVGDEKQSIYKFRGADVQVFNQLKNDLGRTLQMNNNYRSSKELLAAFNALFGHPTAIFDNSTNKVYEAKYLPENFAHKYDPVNKVEIPLPALSRQNSRLFINLLDTNTLKNQKENYLNTNDQIAYYVAETIREKYDKAKALGSAVSFSSFAILDRSRTNRSALKKWLNHFGIPYNQDQNSNLFSDGPVNDVYNLCRICVYPADRNALAAWMASPFANLSESTIETVLCGENPLSPETAEMLSGEQKEKFLFALQIYEQTKQTILTQTLTKTMNKLWLDFGYCYETMKNVQTALFAEQYDMLFEVARQTDADGKGPAWFVDQLAKIKKKEKSSVADNGEMDVKEISYPLEKDDAVQIMTIHKSKGLQFNTVFILGCTDVDGKSDSSKLFFDEDFGLSIVPESGVQNFFSLKQKETATKLETAEFRRLIYVAITRACSEVHIVGYWNPDTESSSPFRLIENYSKSLKASVQDEPVILEEIQPKEKTVLWTVKEEKVLSDEELVAAISPVYDNAKIIKEDVIPDFRKKPSGLETEGNPLVPDANPIEGIDQLDKIISGYIPEEERLHGSSTNEADESGEDSKGDENSEELIQAYFGYNDFGTLAHKFLEDYVNCGMKDDFSEADFTGGIRLYKNLEEEDKKKITESCLKLCAGFGNSSAGKQLKKSIEAGRFVKTEWGFRMFLNKELFTGSIDLIFENEDGCWTIIDYKTDKLLNNSKYTEQQRCYRTAAASMLGVEPEKISCKLFYLRYALEEKLS